jgi:L-arabinose isomerase
MNAEHHVTSSSTLRLGLFGIGLDAYWPQFASLKERLEGYLGCVAHKLARPGETVNLKPRLAKLVNYCSNLESDQAK